MGLLEDAGRLGLGLRQLVVGHREGTLVVGHLGGELGGCALPAFRQRGLELGRCGPGGGALLLEDGLGLAAARGGLAVGVIQQLVGLAVGLVDNPGGVGLGLAAGLGGVTVRGRAGVLHLVGHLDLHGLGILLGAQPDVVGLLLGEAQHLGDPFPEGREIGAVAVRGV